MTPGASGGTSEASFRDNNVDPQNSTIAGIYSQWYKVLNNANHIIEKTAIIPTTDPRKESLIAEAKFIRALSHFYLLRAFGQFYDMNSSYGIVLKDKPILSADPQPRATVKACYDLIISDLDDAITKAPSFSKGPKLVHGCSEWRRSISHRFWLVTGLGVSANILNLQSIRSLTIANGPVASREI